VAPKPENIDIATINTTDKRIWEKRVDEYVKRDVRLTENCEKLYSLIIGQCTEYMTSKLDSLLDYDLFNDAVDAMALIKSIKGLTYQFESQRYHSQALHKAIRRFYRFYQTKDMSNTMFLENFQTLVSVVEYYGGTIGTDPKGAKAELIKEGIDVDNVSDASKRKAMETAKNRYLAMTMLTAADVTRYSRLLEDLDNDYTKGNDNYPRTVTKAYNLIINYRQARPEARIYHNAEGVPFANIGEEGDERAPKDRSHIICFNFQTKGHYANKCPHPKREDGAGAGATANEVGHVKEITEANQFLIASEEIQNEEFEEIRKPDYDEWDNFAFLQPSGQVNKDWILLDNCSTADIFCNKKLLTNIKTSKKTLKIHCNDGTKLITKEGTLRNYGTVWYSKDAIANIMSLSNVKENYPVKYDSEGGNKFTVVKPDNDVVFEQSSAGLYYHDIGSRVFVMVNTIKENREGFTRRELDRAKEARCALALVGYPPPKDVMNMVRSDMIKNCPISPTDITNAHKLCGPDIATLKGKIIRQTPAGVMTEYVEIPKEIISLNKNITLAVDIMFVCGLPFMVSISRKIKFTTAEYLPGRKQPMLIKSLKKILRLYQNRGFKVETDLMDREFECLRDDIPELNLNTTAASEHVPNIERQIRVIKERMRAIKSTLLFKQLPARIFIEMMQYAVLWLNCFPPLSGISQTFSPRTIMTGTTISKSIADSRLEHMLKPTGTTTQLIQWQREPEELSVSDQRQTSRVATSFCA
jgi:hypothetical protein